MASAPDVGEIRRSSRDPEQVRAGLEAWMASKLPDGAAPSVSGLEGTSASGMSSETLLFDAAWTEGGATRSERLVARLAPDPADVPVFPSYDMDRQFRTIRLVGERSSVPVPRTWWSEPDPSVIGTPFFVMGRIDGEVPPDVMPYNFGDSWLFHASPDEQRRLQDTTVGVLAELHTVDPPGFFTLDDPGGTHLRRHIAHTRGWYEFSAARATRSPLIERGFAWLDEHLPRDESPPVLSWGDARIGNVLYRDFEPVAVLDWEMACLGPRELDVAWCIHAHEVFEHLAQNFGLPGMPDFMRRDDVAATYESLSGRTLRDLDFYLTYASVQYGIVFLATGARSVHFGEKTMPDDVDELLYNRSQLERMIS